MNFNIHFLLLLLLYFFFFWGGGGGFRKLNHYGECRFCGYFFGGTIFWVHFYVFTGLFLSSMYRTGIFFVGCLFVVVVFFGVGCKQKIFGLGLRSK